MEPDGTLGEGACCVPVRAACTYHLLRALVVACVSCIRRRAILPALQPLMSLMWT